MSEICPTLPLALPPIAATARPTTPRIKQESRAAGWRQQLARAFAYQFARARTDTDRERLERLYEANHDQPDFARIHRGSDFVDPPRRPFSANEAREIMRQARSIERGTYASREKGQHGGAIGKSALRVLEVLLFVIWPTARRGIYPSLAHLAAKCELSVRTLQTSLAVLKLMGFLDILRRMRRVQTALGVMVQQDTNAYTLRLPTGLGAVGAALFGKWPDSKNLQAKETVFNLYGFSPADTEPHLRE